MSDVERIFDRFIDTFADELIAVAQAYIDLEVARALATAERTNSKQSKAELRSSKREQRLAAKSQLKLDRQRQREEKRTARSAEKERVKSERLAEKAQRQVEHDRLKQERLALKHELEAERRRLREATRKRPARQLPLDFDGLRAPKSRRGVPAANSPPQLFVHKRKRDGQIEKLARNDGPSPAPNVAPSSTNGAAVTNGASLTPPEAPPPAPAE